MINGNVFSSPDTVVIAGFGATYGYVVSTYNIDLGNVRVGLARDTVVTLRNTGNQPIVISSIMSSLPQFVPSPREFTIAAGEDVRDTLRFTPTTVGRVTGKIIFMSDSLWADSITVAANGVLTGLAAKVEIPAEYALSQNYPNPFNPSTTIRYALPQKSAVSLRVYNALGQDVAGLVEGDQEAGYHEVKFDASNLSSGFYIYRLTAGDFRVHEEIAAVEIVTEGPRGAAMSRNPRNGKDPYHFRDRDLSLEPVAGTDYSLHLQPWNRSWNLSCGICARPGKIEK